MLSLSFLFLFVGVGLVSSTLRVPVIQIVPRTLRISPMPRTRKNVFVCQKLVECLHNCPLECRVHESSQS